MSKNNKFSVNFKYVKKLFNLLVCFLIIYSSFIIFDSNILTLTVSGQPGEPTDFTATAVDTDQIDLSWTMGSNSDKTYIEWNTTSGWNLFEGTEFYNGSDTSASHSGLVPHTTYYYQAWSWNETEENYSINYVSDNDITWNTPPAYGTPSPGNETTGIDLSLTWSIFISDSDDDTFNWTIVCSNGQSSSANSASNGTKQLSITGLSYSTSYTIWINTTDGFDWTRAWFTFTTKTNNPPIFGTPDPTNGSTGNLLSFTWSISISDSEGDSFDWTIQCSNGQGSSDSGALNGTKSLVLSGLSYYTVYSVWVNATDSGGSGLYTRGWYQFTTLAGQSPTFGTPNPVNGSTNQPLSLTWSIPINDPEGDLFSWTIQCSNGQDSSDSGALNGTKSLVLSGLSYYTVYSVWVNATDGYYTSSAWFTFTTEMNNPPVFGTPDPTNGSTGNLLSFTWSISISDPEGDSFDWTIQCSNGQSANANGAYNSTKYLSLSGLSYSTIYRVWVNATDSGGSGLYTRAWYQFATIASQVPFFGTPIPSNGSTNQPLSLTWSIPINDPEGDLFSWTIQCSNGQNNNGSGATNGTKQLVLSGLSYLTNYTIWVNATDGYNSTLAWFTFYTRAYSPPGGGGSQPPSTPTDNPPSISSISRTPININSKNNVTISATVTDDTGLKSVFLFWNDGSQHSKEMTLESNNKYSTVIGPFNELVTITYWINATDNTSQSTESISYSFKVEDISGPSITVIKPIPESTIYDTTPTIKVSFSDPSGIDTDRVILNIDGIVVILQNITSSSITYTSTVEMTYTTHTVILNVSDLLGNSQIKEWSFTIKETEFITEEDLGNLSSGEEKEIKLENSDETGIDSINFRVAINLTNVKIFVAKLIDKPEQINNLPKNTTLYCYLQIDANANDTDIDNDSFYSVKIKFKVKNDWLKNSNIDKNNINLVKYQNDIWVIQYTKYLTEDNTYTYYETSMSGFSTLAIVGTKITTGEIVPAPGFNYIFVIIAVILIIILIVAILFKTGILYVEEEYPEEDTEKEYK